MATLTKTELDFLKQHGFAPHDVYNGIGLKLAHFKVLVKKEGKPIALGSPCTNGGHRLKWPSTHCAQCNPAAKSFRGRFTETKYVDIAGSLSKKLIKIGVGSNPKKRIDVLRLSSYGSADDWELLFEVKVPNAGRVEYEALSSLGKYRRKPGYIKDGNEQTAIEVVKCSYITALKAINRATESCLSEPWQSLKIAEYNFK